MTTTPIIVRPLETPEERLILMQWADTAFAPQPSPESVQRRHRYIMGLPEFRPEQMRGAFRGSEMMGGYMIYERWMRMGEAQILSGCISIVVTGEAYRNQRVATSLMHDAIAFGQSRNHGLLLLDGIPKFYYRYGYTDVIDLDTIDIDRTAILAQPSTTYTIRTATSADAEALVRLYNHCYSSYTGSFVRSIEQQAYRVEQQREQPVIAIAPDGTVQGYLAALDGALANEVAADNWEALLALLRYHVQLFPDKEAPATLRYRIPFSSPMMYWLQANLEVPDTSQWLDPAEEWVVRGQSYHHRHAGWMARVAHLPTLMQAILPALQVRWQRSLAHWNGAITLLICEEAYTLTIVEHTVQIEATTPPTLSGAYTVRMTPQLFAQLLFGYRPVSWVVQSLPTEVQTVLSILFPAGHAWLPRTDWF